MSQSLQDQLRQAGLASDKQGKKSKWGKVSRPSKKASQQKPSEQTEAQKAAEQARAEQAARAEALNREKQAAAKRRAALAEIRQIIESNTIDLPEEGDPYHFTDQGKVRSIVVSARLRDQLTTGRNRIVRFNDQYRVVPQDAADKIAQRDPDCVIAIPQSSESESDDDYYAQFKVPDDLIW